MIRKVHYCCLGLSVVGVFALGACGVGEHADRESGAPVEAKVVVTTASVEARDSFLRGRDLAEKLRATEARVFFEEAVTADPGFALAHLALANSATTAQGFFDSLERAVELAESVSEGERLMILGQDAGTRGDAAAQQKHYDALVEAFPGDERGHNLLGTFYFGRQEYEKAIEHYERATTINPDYSPPYNLLGYAHRAVNRFDEAEAAFKKYIALIPDEPNPYDSYAELLMKMGRFEESIANYEIALAKNPSFVFSLVGVGHNQILLGETGAARSTYRKLYDKARNDGERRTALLWTTASYLHEGDPQSALEQCEKMRAIAEASGDWASVSGDFVLEGDIHLEAGESELARGSYAASMKAVERADVNEDVKEAARRNQIFREARLALLEESMGVARERTEAFAGAVSERNLPFEVRRVHELQGLIALHDGDHASALAHLEQANQQNPRVLLEMSWAAESAGDLDRAREIAERAARFNQLNINYAHVREKAEEFLDDLG